MPLSEPGVRLSVRTGLSTDLGEVGGFEPSESEGLDALPVVSRASVHQLIGIVTFDDVLALYRQPFPRPVTATKTEDD